MDTKIKAALKDAREAINQKDFKGAMKLCKVALTLDRNSYNGLVLFGVALQETEQKDQAEKAFKKAINVAPSQMLAYQGLMGFYEKNNSRTKEQDEELLKTYLKMLSLESDRAKFTEICIKLPVLVQKLRNIEESVEILSNLQYEGTDAQHSVVKKTFLNFLLQVKELSPTYKDMLEQKLESFVNDNKNSTEDVLDYSKKYLKLLYQYKKNNLLITEAKKLHLSYPSAEFPLEWLCKVYSEDVANTETSSLTNDEIIQYCNRLLALNPVSSMALLAKGAQLFQLGAFYESSELLKRVQDMLPQSVYPLAFLCQCHEHMHCFYDVVIYASKACAILYRQTPLNTHLLQKLRICWATALSKQDTKESMAEAIVLCNEFLPLYVGDPDLVISLARSYLHFGSYKQDANALLKDHKTNDKFNSSQSALLQALYLKSEQKFKEAENVLSSAAERDASAFELWLELGQLQSKDGKRDIALQAFLKAAKLAPHCSSCFLHLGQEYGRDGKDLDKARRCFLKALQLDPRLSEAALGLADVYKRLGNEEGYLNVLHNATKQVDCGRAKWAWLRLGMLDLEHKNYEQAITRLVATIRMDPNDSHCWETLGDAYYARGSFTSALKSYARVRELHPESLYAMFQIANIKLTLGMYEESAEQFTTILRIDASYVPALKGLGETYLLLAKSYLARQLLGLCRDHCQLAVNALSRAASARRDLSCVWKLLGDVCLVLARLPDAYAMLHVQPTLVEGGAGVEGEGLLTKCTALQVGARYYCRALALTQDIASLIWQDLAVNYHLQADNTTDAQRRLQLREWAMAAAKKCVSLNPKNCQHWNVLGIVAASEELQNYRLAQHAFIKSIESDSKNVAAWTNLGTLYLTLGQEKLANRAFTTAQGVDPSHVHSWVGQASIAEARDHPDAMDLFRHTTELGVHPESCLGYARWVCEALSHSERRRGDADYVYTVEKMHAVSVAADCMVWYTGMHTSNPCAYNMLGVLFERQGVHSSAAGAFEKSLELLMAEEKTDDLQDIVRTNYGRVLVELQFYKEAIHQYQLLKEPNFTTQCGLALAYFKHEMYEESYGAYETALHWASDDGLKSHVLVAMAAMAYMFQGVDDSQTLIYQCISLKPPSVQGLFAACSLGMLHSDLSLSELVLKELDDPKYKDNPDYRTDIATFEAYVHYLQNDSVAAVRVLSRYVHRHPGEASLWLALALLMLHDHPRQSAPAAGRCAQVAVALGRGSMDVTKVMSVVSLSNLLSGKGVASLRSSQKAVHMYPDIAENWAVLIASYFPRCVSKRSHTDALWLNHIIDHVKRKVDSSRKVGKWLSNYERITEQLIEEYKSP